MKNITVSLLHTAWIEEEKEEIDAALFFVDNYCGTNFILDACIYLYQLLKTDYIFVGIIQSSPIISVKTKVLLKYGLVAENISYSLSGSVCETVIGKEQNYFPAGIQDIFPGNALLQKMQVDSYLGIPLYNKNEIDIGCLALLHRTIIERGGFVEALVNVLMPRIEEELELF